MSTLVADTRAVFQREMSLVLRDPLSIIFSLRLITEKPGDAAGLM